MTGCRPGSGCSPAPTDAPATSPEPGGNQLAVAAGHVGNQRQQLALTYFLFLQRVQALGQNHAFLLQGREPGLVGLVLAVERGAPAEGNQLHDELAFQPRILQRVADVAPRLLNQLGVVAIQLADDVVLGLVGRGPLEGAFYEKLRGHSWRWRWWWRASGRGPRGRGRRAGRRSATGVSWGLGMAPPKQCGEK